MTAQPQYLRVAKVARLLGVSERTVRRWIANGLLCSTKVGGARLISKVAVEKFLADGCEAFESATLEEV